MASTNKLLKFGIPLLIVFLIAFILYMNSNLLVGPPIEATFPQHQATVTKASTDDTTNINASNPAKAREQAAQHAIYGELEQRLKHIREKAAERR